MDKVIGVGLMSGTSLDGIDAAIVELAERDGKLEIKLLHSLSKKYPDDLRGELMEVCSPAKATVQKISSLNMYLGKMFGETVNELLQQSQLTKEDIHFISSHGQTIYHQPFQGSKKTDLPGTLQIGDLSVLAEVTDIAVVGDFRTADMAAGGQGAPLVSYVDFLLFQSPDLSRAVQNIGGIGNVTYLQKGAASDQILSFDTGPGNMVIDEIVHRLTNGEQKYDHNGEIASRGRIHEPLLNELMSHEYIALEPPKTTGRELFGRDFADSILASYGGLKTEDLVATVTEWTAVSIAQSYKDYILHRGFPIDEVIIGGGGSYNTYLLERIRKSLPDISVHTHEQFGINSDYKEAIAFAVLGYQCIRGKYNQLPHATGANKQVIMGKTAYTSPSAFERLNVMRRQST